jgi:predicted acylesterase/phospholipase RssA
VKGEAILAGQHVPVDELLELVDILADERKFGLARKILDRYADKAEVKQHRQARQFAQKRALCTYKDPDLPADPGVDRSDAEPDSISDRFDRALDILNTADPLNSSTDQETLGQAGAIYKRKWELTGSQRFLETSLAYYLRGHARGVAKDYGYTSVNAAFVLDLLADGAMPEPDAAALSNALAEQRRAQAQSIRKEIADVLPPLLDQSDRAWLKDEWWFLVTLGEAHFGLQEFERADHWLQKAAKLPKVPDWERESTARQLAALLRLHGTNREGEKVLREFLGGSFAAVNSVTQGKIGLALSGGGFRASLYHIGVLARLAELDLLRKIEYLSCVSGGSIIGAHYYLEVRHLLQTKSDQEITRQDYLAIIHRLIHDFLTGVQRNVRTRIAAEWITNLKMVIVPDYSRTLRAGELYESEIFSRVDDGEGGARWLNSLYVRPKGDENFVPKDSNWRRSAKVPILMLNATTLNTGHNWQFTASWMGEPPEGADAKIDANYRLRRMYYSQLPPNKQRIRLGHAVAASACVPGLFEPLSLTGIYQNDVADKPILVRLVDGGVHDNQGFAPLLEQGCTVLLVSDASGQMDSQNSPSGGMIGVPLRSNSILQARIRSSQFRELEARRRSGLLRGLMFVHLKKDLGAEPVDWIDCQDRSQPVRCDPLLPYGIHRDVQRRIAAIRTDLDSFSEVEAYALMTSGYCMTVEALQHAALGFQVPKVRPEEWPFLEIQPLMKRPSSSTLMRQLEVADRLAFKIWTLSRTLQMVGGILFVTALFLLGLSVWQHRSKPVLSLTVGALAATCVGVVLGIAGWPRFTQLIRYRKSCQSVLIGIVMATLGWWFARIHLHVFDKLFLRFGRLERLLRSAEKVRAVAARPKVPVA